MNNAQIYGMRKVWENTTASKAEKELLQDAVNFADKAILNHERARELNAPLLHVYARMLDNEALRAFEEAWGFRH